MPEFVRFTNNMNRPIGINPEEVCAISEFNAHETNILLTGGETVRVRQNFEEVRNALQGA